MLRELQQQMEGFSSEDQNPDKHNDRACRRCIIAACKLGGVSRVLFERLSCTDEPKSEI
jgi:hypothetical protein